MRPPVRYTLCILICDVSYGATLVIGSTPASKSGWCIASWYCCPKNLTVHSTYLGDVSSPQHAILLAGGVQGMVCLERPAPETISPFPVKTFTDPDAVKIPMH